MSRISVVIPTYNRADLIGETLDRVLAQSLPAHEIIVIDDGSTDETQARLLRYAGRVQSIVIQNAGELVARNTGLRAAAGDLVAFCDSDDLWQPDHLARLAPFWADPAPPIAAYADFEEVRDGQWVGQSKFSAAPAGYWDDLQPAGDCRYLFTRPIIDDLLAFQPFFPSCMMVDRARFLARGGWDEGVSRMVGCDFATTLRIAAQPPIGVLRQATVGIRKHAGNFSADVLRMNLGDADVLSHVLTTRPALAPYAPAIRRSIEQRRGAAFDSAFASGDLFQARAIAARLTADRPPAHRVKAAAIRLPPPLDKTVWRALTWLGTRRSGPTD